RHDSSLHAFVDKGMALRRAHYWLANDPDVVDVYKLRYTLADVNGLDGPVVRVKRVRAERIIPLKRCSCENCGKLKSSGQHRLNTWGWRLMPPEEGRAHVREKARRATIRQLPEPNLAA